jgi:hypothetical protein
MLAAPSTPSLRARRHQMTAGEALIALSRDWGLPHLSALVAEWCRS